MAVELYRHNAYAYEQIDKTKFVNNAITKRNSKRIQSKR